MQDLRHIDKLPDTALIDVPTFATLINSGVSTTWRKLASDPTYPKLIRLGTRCTRVRLGDVRALIAGRAE